jgi:iron complex outermembrane receptor protein
MNVDDEIAWNNLTNQNENLDQTRHLGGEMDFRYSLMKPLSLYGGAGYNNTEFTAGENDGKKIPLIPAWKGHAGLEWQSGIGLLARLQYNYFGSRYFGSDNGNDQKKMKAYHTLDVYVSYKYKFMELFFNGNNILDETYSDFAFYNVWNDTFNYYPMPEAMYYGGIRVRF